MLLISQRDIIALLDISKETLWRWRKNGEFLPPAIKRGRYVRWRVADVAKWLNVTEEELIRQIQLNRTYKMKSAGVRSTGTNDKSVMKEGLTNAKIH